MNNIQYYVLVRKDIIADDTQRKEIYDIEKEITETKLPFSENFVDIYLISDDKEKCLIYIKSLNENIQEFFNIEQVGSEIQYTAFIDILGFSNYIKDEITSAILAEEFYNTINEVVDYIKYEKEDKFTIGNANFLKNINIKYSWISDTFVISIEYLNEVEKGDENIIKSMIVFRLSIIISSVHHFMASIGFIIRGGISSKFSCITNNFILGEGVVEASYLEKEIAIYPRVVFEKNIISFEINKLISRHYSDNDLNFIKKDFDGYYFVNYLSMLQYIPPMIGKVFKMPDHKIKQFQVNQKIKVIEKYKEIVTNGINIPNEKVNQKYMWLNNYLYLVINKDKFKKNIAENNTFATFDFSLKQNFSVYINQ